MFVLNWKIKCNSDIKHKMEDKKMVPSKNKMWFASPDSGSGGIALAYSDDGINWTEYNNSLPLAGLNPGANHPVVLYDPSGFAGGSFYYKTWYWDSAAGLNTINTIRYAESSDGITWQNDQSIQQHPTNQTLQLVDGVSGSYFYHCYGPGSLLYNPTATNVGSGTPDDKSDDSPMTYRYVVYYDSSGEGASPNGSIEQTSLAYSTDGIYWIRCGNEPVLLPSGDQSHWDGWYSFRGCVKATASGYHMWYSGANGDNSIGTYYAHGIGYASSTDGLNWIKDPDNPVFHVTDGVGWRDVRTYTPSVLYDANQFSGHGAAVNWKMWFTGRTGSNYTIGYADRGDELPVAVMDCISTGSVGEEHCLDGSASYDPDGDTIVEYTWDLAAKPAGSSAAMSPADEAQSCFIPDIPGTYVLSLTAASKNISGEIVRSAAAHCEISIKDRIPVAVFACTPLGKVGETICFDAFASYDPDGSEITGYSWGILSKPLGSQVELSSLHIETTCFSPDMEGIYSISLQVSSQNSAGETAWSKKTDCVIQIQGYTYCFCPEVVLNVERVEDRMWHKSYKIEKLNWITTCSTPCCEIEKYKIYRMENSNWELVAEVDAHINNFELKNVKEWHEYKVIPFLPGNKECLGRIELNNQLHKPHHPNAGRRKVDR